MNKKALIVVFLALGMAGTVSGVSQGQLHYRLNETGGTLSKDYTGNGNDATSFDGSPTQGVEGISKSSGSWGDDLAYDFDEGQDDHINTGNVSVNNDFTLSAWIKVDSGASGQENIMGSFDGTDGVIWRDVDSDGNLDLWINGNTANGALNYNNGKWYFAAVVFDDSANEATFYLNKTNTTLSISADKTQIDNNWDVSFPGDGGATGNNRPLDGTIDEPRIFNKALNSTEIKNLRKINCPDGSCGKAPSIDSTDYDPDDPDVNDTIDTYMNASDPDGDTITGYLTVEEGGTTIIDGKVMDTAGPHDFRLLDNFTADEVDTYYNMTFKASDGNTNTSTERSFYINDTSPGLKVVKPKNQTYFKYHPAYEVKVNGDADDVPNENSDCTLYDDGSPFRSVTLTEGGSSVNGQVNHTVGQYSFTGECTEQNASANTVNDTKTYTIDRFNISSISGTNQTFETVNNTFSTGFKAGNMVEEITLNLYYNNSIVASDLFSNNGITSYSENLFHEAPLVFNNNSKIDWNFGYSYTFDSLNSNDNLTTRENSTIDRQWIWWSYYTENVSTDENAYVEQDVIKFDHWIHGRTDKASVSGEAFYNQTGKTKSLGVTDKSSTKLLETSFESSDQDNPKKQTYGINDTVSLSFEGRTRQIQETVTFTVSQIQVTSCGGSGAEALKIKTYSERNLDNQVFSNLDIALQAWNPGHSEFKRSFNFSSSDKKTHTFCIKPTDETYYISTINKKIEYEGNGTDFNSRSYYIINETIDNSTTEIPLYLNWRNQTSEVEYKIVDDQNDPVPQIIIGVERYFPGEDRYVRVESLRTGSEGLAYGSLAQGDTTYQYKLYDGFELVQEEPDSVIPDDLTVQFVLGDTNPVGYYDNKGKVSSNCQVHNVTYFNCTYSSDTNRLNNITLDVDSNEKIGFSDVCSVSSQSLSGELVCSGLNTSKNKYKYGLVAEFSDGSIITVDTGFFGSVSKPYGKTGLFISFMLFVTLTGAGAWKPEASLALGGMALLVASFTGFLAVSQTALISIVSITAIMIWRMS